ncbi:MAG: putative DCC family thiol-disulfide oxidoreductase YuxK [Arcticibacterium sp.]|jgi:predicted DCC family thiol-disulfide oxidoreductase YuxK
MKLILFDGVCNLCNGFVNFIIDRDKKKQFKFASLQSAYAQKLLKDRPNDLDSVVFYDGESFLEKSEAVFEIAEILSGYKWLRVLKVIPKGIRDSVYDFIAKNRYKFFGQRETCRISTPDLKGRFLEH